jgi:DNA polymerase family A
MTPPEYILDDRYETILMAAYDLRWPAPRIIEADEIPAFLASYNPAETVCCSHNALFDMSILSWRYGWVAGRMQDTLGMVRALRKYKINSLGAVMRQLFNRDTKGDVVHKVIGMHAQDIKNAGLWPSYRTYAMHDARDCAHIYAKLEPEFPVEEREVMDLVLRAAVTPVLYADAAMLEKHLVELRTRKRLLLNEAGFSKAALMSTAQFRHVLEQLGVEIKGKKNSKGQIIPAFSKTDAFMSELLEYEGSYDDDTNYAVQTLAMARLSHKSTIEESRAEKFVAIAKLPWARGGCVPHKPPSQALPAPEMALIAPNSVTSVSRGACGAGNLPSTLPDLPDLPDLPLLPVALRYGGAHTHRLSGEWKLNMQNLPRDKLKSKLRTALVAPPGHRLITADLAQIEARIVAKLSGQDDLVGQFRNGEDVYANFATDIFAVTCTKASTPNHRFIGKTAILGLGYGCGHARFYQMVTTQARQYGIALQGIFDEGIARKTVALYRWKFSRIEASWHDLDWSLKNVINNYSETQTETWGPVTISSARILLPNDMYLRYQIGDIDLYGAKLLENITQALARIVVMQAAVRLARRGYRFALQAHDELVFVVLEEQVEKAKSIIYEEMVTEPSWLPGLPLAVEIGEGRNYGEAK